MSDYDCGDGSDGDAVISVPTVARRPMQYRTLSFIGDGCLDPNGFIIKVQGGSVDVSRFRAAESVHRVGGSFEGPVVEVDPAPRVDTSAAFAAFAVDNTKPALPPIAFMGLPIENFCEPCADLIRWCSEGDRRVNFADGICPTDKAQIAAIPWRSAYPPPWRWTDEGELVDANGVRLIRSDDAFPVVVASPAVRAVTELSPEMEALLRKHQFSGCDSDGAFGQCPECSGEGKHWKDCDLGILLARIEEARKAGG
ncbi:MAG: hypothetical protein EPN98_21610 [Phenylobacterium sp.]|uniref:hypothetical protein n=1 Tax=Phenylobacterium sp. TaxID=1871053 RepID=UPI0012214BF4|nr:hypothetical protein [Phenylobacterium sp.]TAL29042.1 MAG: hypothetical protein EPN98_21610 [Phenylobacterium sp.]